MKKYDAERWGQVDGERYALRWIELNGGEEMPEDELEWKIVSSAGKEDTESASHTFARERKLDSHKKERGWYVAAFMTEARKVIEGAYRKRHAAHLGSR